MGQKGYISEFMNGGRIVAHGKIESLANGFKLPNNIPFSVYVRPKTTSNTEALDVLLNVKCYQDEKASDAPVVLNDWTPMAIIEILPDMNVLGEYDIYWGSGSYVETI